jgi:hypothetical protein
MNPEKEKIIIWVMGTFGVLLIFFGVFCSLFITINQNITAIFSSLGGMAFGASMSAVFAKFATSNLENKIINVIKESYAQELELDEEKIEKYRKILYMYHITKIDNFVWRETVLDFSDSRAVGKLSVPTLIVPFKRENSSEVTLKYSCKGYIKADKRRFILCCTPQKEDDEVEPSSIYIFPEFGNRLQVIKVGIAIMRTCVDTNIITKCILSEERLVDSTYNGSSTNCANTVLNQKDVNRLNELWEQQLPAYDNLPSAT